MNTKLEKAKTWVKEHKKEILIGAGATVITGVGILLGQKVLNRQYADLIDNFKGERFMCDDGSTVFKMFELADAFKYKDGSVELMLDKCHLNDLGKFGEEILEKIPELPENEQVWMLMNIHPENAK